jgi:acyl dehydratase
MESYRVRARNTAPDSENRMHSDETAARYGFRGGLVPGVTVYGYMTERLPVEWLETGGMKVRFLQPFYDGEDVEVEVDGSIVTASRTDGTLCAEGTITWPHDPVPKIVDYPAPSLPATRPPASAEALAPGRVLSTISAKPDLVNTEKLLELSNRVLMANVALGPWIHTASEVRHLSLAAPGEELNVRAKVVDQYERKGHDFVVLDVLVIADTRPVQQVRHTAIWRPRVSAP